MSLKPGLFHLVLIWIYFLTGQSAFSQSYSTSNNYTGSWETPTSWTPTWPSPQTNVNGHDLDIFGYITTSGSLSFSGSSKLTVKDTLVIKGNLTLNDNNDLKIEDNGILIVWGNLTISYDTKIEANGYLIVTGNIIKVGDIDHGEFKSNDDPVRVFVGGTIPSGLTDDNSRYRALDCTSPHTDIYPASNCSYGNMTDLTNDPIYPFFQSTCSIVTPTITAGGPSTFCAGGSVILTSSAGSTYLWSNGATTQNINVSVSGSYSVRVTNTIGCQSAPSVPIIVTVNALPGTPTISAGGPTTFCAGGSITLTSSPENTYLWSTGATTASINVTLSGNYIVRVTDANGCQSVASAAAIVAVNALPPTPTITAGGPITFCAGGSVTLTSGAGSGYLWSTGATTGSIDVTLSGSYTVSLTDANGCQSSPSTATVVTVNSLPVTPTITAGGPTTFCAGGSVTLSSSTETDYLWSNGATTSSINVSISGSYSVTVTNASGCQSAPSTAIAVTVNALPAMPVITAGGPTTFCAGESVTLTSSPGASYVWSNTAISPTINVTISGSYSVKVTDANGCQSAPSAIEVVTINSLPVVNAGTDVTIPNGTITAIDATVTGAGPFTYNWSPSALLINPLAEDPTTVILTSTTIFTLTATSIATSCSSSGTVTITISGGPLSATPAATPGTVCAGESVQLYANAGGGSGTYTYSWTSTPAGFTSSSVDPIVNPLVTTTYYVAVFDGFNTVNSQVVVTVNALPAIPTITTDGPTTFCEGGSVNLTSVAGTSYLWSTGETTPTVNISTPGSFTVQVTNTDGCQSAPSLSTVVTVNSLPPTPAITAGGPTTFCAGSSITLTSSPGSGYLWSNGATTANINISSSGSFTVKTTDVNGCQSAMSSTTVIKVNSLPATPTIIADGPTTFCAGGNVTLTSSTGNIYLWSSGATTPNIDVTLTGSYSVRVTDVNGCQSAGSAGTPVTVNDLPATPTISAGGPTTFCAGGSVVLTSSAGSGYLWSTGATTGSINVTSSGIYKVRVTDANGCQSSPSSATVVTVNSLPVTPTISAGGPTTFCAGGSVTLTSSAETGYLWSNGATTSSINVSSSGNYSVRVTNVSGCQSAPSTATDVTVNALPSTPVITAGGPTTFCAGGNVTLSSSPESSYLWSNGATAPAINVTTSGSYSVRVTNANGCQSAPSVPALVIVNALPSTPTIAAGGPTTFCKGGSVNLTSSAGTSYQWSNAATTPTINITTGGSYSVRVTDANGCQSVSSVPTIATVNSLPVTPTITAGGPTVFCTGGNVTLTSSAATSYLWSSGETTLSIIASSSGSYKVQVTDANGCQSSPSITAEVTILDGPPAPAITADSSTTFCIGGSVNLISSSGTSFLWSTGAATREVNITTTGSYTVKVTNINGCYSVPSAAMLVTVVPKPVVNITSNGSSMCISDVRTLSGNPSGGIFIVTGGPGKITGNVLSATGSGQINLEYIYDNVCITKATQSIIIDENVTADAGSDQEVEYVFETQMDAGLSQYGTGEWSLVSGSGKISDLHSPITWITELSIGENKFLWRVINGGCEATDEVLITVKDIVTPTVITPNEDGLNDELIFPGLTAFPGSTIIIYNRWGSEVYRSADYKNDWNGKDNKKRDLQEDTYYYVLRISNGRVLKGFLEIKR